MAIAEEHYRVPNKPFTTKVLSLSARFWCIFMNLLVDLLRLMSKWPGRKDALSHLGKGARSQCVPV